MSLTTPRLFRLARRTWDDLGEIKEKAQLRSRSEALAVAARFALESFMLRPRDGELLAPFQIFLDTAWRLRRERRAS